MVKAKQRKRLGKLFTIFLTLQLVLSWSTTLASSPTGNESATSGVEASPNSQNQTVTEPQTEPSNTKVISSKVMSVMVDKNFPSVIQYQWLASGAVMYGQEDAMSQIKINDIPYSPTVTYELSSTSDTANYKLEITSIGVEVDMKLQVVKNTLLYQVTNIVENGSTKVSKLEIPNLNLLSVRSTESGAAFSGSRMYTAVSGSGDTFKSVTGAPSTDSSPVNYLYGIVNTNQLAGSIWTNAVADYSKDNNNERILKQTVNKGSYYRTGLWSYPWICSVSGSVSPEPLPSTKVVITPDANSDGTVDWQDGAIAFRSIMNVPVGSDRVPDLAVFRIPMNFASEATNPFLKTLDETKRVYLNTDGLGQWIEHKGYQGEGHDQNQFDYRYVGKRQGGAADLEQMASAAHQYNGFVGVHIGATGLQPESSVFSDTLGDVNHPGWDWLDPAYDLNPTQMRYEGTSNNRLNRLQQLKNAVPSLDFMYVDAWFEKAWNGQKLAREINSLGWTTTTEFPDVLENDSVWYHWAVDYKYGGSNIKGFNSQIARFIRNHQKDTWIARNPLLGGAEVTDFEGWQGNRNYDNAIQVTFETNLPTKYMQHFKIMKWTGDTINFENNVNVSNASGSRVVTKDGITLLSGNKYLLPWSPATEDKLYHWNADGGNTTWTLPSSWAGLQTVKLYQLTDQGKQLISDLPVSNNQIAINAIAKTPYVVYKGAAAANPTVNWGEGTQVKDPGFNSGNLNAWTVAGSDTSVERNPSGQYELMIGSGSGATVSQQITGLSEGTYYASVYVSTSNGRKAYIGVNNYGGPEVSNYADSSLWSNYIQADSKRDTNMQRMYLFFDVPAGSTTATLYLKADSGTSTVTFDDVRIGKTVKTPNPDGAYFVQDFEHALQGWYPFVKGPAGGTNDPRTHLSELHAPYTQKGWNGKAIDDVISGNYSLKAYKESSGLLYQTIPQMVRLIPGTTYTVKFKYESAASDYAFVIGDSTTIQSTTTLKEATSPETFKAAFVASSSGQSWFGIKKKAGATDFVMDDLVITLGGDPSQNIPTDQSTSDPNMIPHSQMTATATDAETENEDNGPSNAIDDDESTIWHTRWDNPNQFPQSITLNLGGTYNINQIKYLPRQDGGKNGMITNYNLYTSTDGINFTKATSGTWATDDKEKSVVFTSTSAAFVKLEATNGYNGWASAAEINVFKDSLPALAIAGGAGTVTVQNAVLGAILKLYDSLNQVIASLTATGTAADQFTGVPAGAGYSVTQTVYGVESAHSNAVSVSILLDQTKPVTELVVAGTTNNGWYNSQAVTLHATDDMSGVEKTQYKLSENGDWTDYYGAFSLPQDGTYTIQYRSADRAGNVEDAKQQTVKVDTTLPDIKFMIIGKELKEGDSFDDNLPLTFQVSDHLSGVASAQISVSDAVYAVDLTKGTSIVIDLTGKVGSYSAAIVVEDMAGNRLQKNFQFNVTSSINAMNALLNHYQSLLSNALTSQLSNALSQAQHQLDKNRRDQAAKHMQDFVKHLNNPALGKDVDSNVKAILNADANALIKLWSTQ
ncbi:endo-alpha-N-acetylgalactosaminidase family protein [Paenibacillus germinis]|nr:endo-alpha-N-acetylgalactosaminidase family protein [Paenibacillus germinis]